jgi:MFS family permease
MESFFKNKTVNLLNLHAGLHRFSNNIFDTFGAIYLIHLGLSFPVVALAWAGSCIIRFFLRPLSVMFSKKIGLRKALIFGVVVNSGVFFVLSQINGLGAWLYFYMLYLALSDITYWLPYHSYYAVAGDTNLRGKQVGIQLGFIAVMRMIAPLVGGILIASMGFISLYGVATIVMLISALPLFFTKNIAPGKNMGWEEALRSIDKRGLVMQMGDGILYMHGFIWTIVLFYLVGNYVTFGGLVAFEIFVTTILFLFLGYFIGKNNGSGRNFSKIGLGLIGLVIVLRAFLVYTVPEIIFSDIIIALAMTFYSLSFGVGFYNLAKKSANTLWFHFFGECGWDMGAAIALSVGAGLYSLGMPLRFIIIFSIFGLMIIYKVLMKIWK